MSLRNFNITLQPGQSENIDEVGNFLIVYSSTDTIDLLFDGEGRAEAFSTFSHGTENNFKQIRLENNTSNTVNIKLGIGTGVIRDGRLTVTNVVITSKGTKYNTLSAVAVGTTAVQAAAVNTDRTELHLTNNSSETLYYGDSGVTTTDGQTFEAQSLF